MFNFDWLKKIFRDKELELKAEKEVYQFKPLPCVDFYGPSIWSVGGGKGGVGKSFIASNLGVSLSRMGKTVLLIDADLGAANLHTFLGTDGGRLALSSFLKEEISDIQSLIIKTPVPGLDLISGAKDSLDIADINPAKIARLKEALRKLPYDNVILDIGPGTSANLLDIFLLGGEGIILSTPEPTTIENNYRFLKCLFLRKIKNLSDSQEDGRLKDMLQKIFSEKWPQRVKTVSDIIGQLQNLDSGQGRMLREYVGGSSISMIMNQSRRPEDGDIGYSIKKACTDYFGVDIRYLGAVSYEDAVGESVRTRRPLMVHYAQSTAARGIEACLKELLNRNINRRDSQTLNSF
ncbi:MAG: P-loop NTPase [Deltaproteobacteria bacterium]|nr:P-loop NTPase [Deltaproteobacteria bacterium]